MIWANSGNWYIWIAILLVVVVGIYAVYRLVKIRPIVIKMEQKYDHLLNYVGTPFNKSIIRKMILIGLIVTVCILMLLRPSFGTEQGRVAQSSLDVAFVVDISLSMGVQDSLGKSRIETAQDIMKKFLEQSSGERVALVSYTTFATTEVPLTYDLDTVHTGIETLRLVDYTYASGSSMSTGIAEAVTRLTRNNDSNRQKVIILLGDGEELNGAELQDAIASASGSDIPIFTVGVGSTSGDKIPYFTSRSGEVFYIREQGRDVVSKMMPDLLEEIADKTNGKFYDSNTPGGNIHTDISVVSREQQFTQGGILRQEIYPFFAFIILILLIVVHFKLYEKVSLKHTPKAFQIAPISLTSVVLLPIIYVSSLVGIQQGNLLYTRNEFIGAKETYNTYLQKDGQNPRLLYNSGVASYRANLYKEAIQSLSRAAEHNNSDISQKASYNLGNAYYRDGQTYEQTDPATTVQQWIRAIAAYDLALQKDPNDTKAYENREFVKKKLEALQQKQEQSNGNNGSSSSENQQDLEERIEEGEQTARDRYNRFGRYRNDDGYSRGQGGSGGPQW
ncbi:MAG: VWA domain-containing protein [Candidatus Dojkabacteria bacterium]|nr:MAG: VWA domain-containing protein [Candidatus Dojkabacteria bacterium]